VAAVDEGGAASAAGLKPGDIIMEINSKQITFDDNLSPLMRENPDSVMFLVVDEAAYNYHASKNICITGDMRHILYTRTPRLRNSLEILNEGMKHSPICHKMEENSTWKTFDETLDRIKIVSTLTLALIIAILIFKI